MKSLNDENDILHKNVELLSTRINAMHADFAKCAKEGISPCFFCANDEKCNGLPKDCNFVWNPHN